MDFSNSLANAESRSPIHPFIRQLPKAELHMHLEGSLEPDLMFKLAERNQIKLPWDSPQALQRAFQFTNLQSFLDVYFEGCRVLRREQDFYELTLAYLTRVSQDGVRHAEVFLGPQSFTQTGVPIEVIMNGVLSALREGEKSCHMTTGFLVSAHRHRREADALALLESVRPWYEQLAGFGLGGAERGNPPTKFSSYFAQAQRLGFKTTIHAGEEGPVDYVKQGLHQLKVDRIDHGNAALDDPQIMHYLAQTKIPLTLCPLSNLLLKVVPQLAQHPVKKMLQAGLLVSINSDDPSYFGGYLAHNWQACQQALELSRSELVQLAKNSFQGAFLPADQKKQYVAAVDDFVQHWQD